MISSLKVTMERSIRVDYRNQRQIQSYTQCFIQLLTCKFPPES